MPGFQSLFRSFVLAAAVFATARANADVPQYRHDHLNAYPAAQVAASPAGLRIDGSLADWKPGAFVQMYADPDLKDVFSLKLALAYDATGLIVAAHYVDDSPMVNHVDPRTNPFGGWNGDALQIRLVTDPSIAQPIAPEKNNSDSVTHITLWYYTDDKLPAVDIRHGMDFHNPKTYIGSDANFAYRADGNGAGYTVEGRIPWSEIGGSIPKPGNTELMTVQPLWGDADGRYKHSFFDDVRAAGFQFQSPSGWGRCVFVSATQTATVMAQQQREEVAIFGGGPQSTEAAFSLPVRYINPQKGFVSVAICRPDGYIVRTLLAKAERGAGPQTEQWDGKDDYGNPVPPGQYIVKALVHQGIVPHFICSVMNSGNPSWGNKGGHYGWGADHGNPDWAAADPNGNVYLLWTFDEGGNYLIKVDKNGQKQWGADGRGASVTYGDGLVYVGAADWPRNTTDPVTDLIHVYDAASGKFLGTHKIGDPWPQTLYDRSVETANMSDKMRDGNFTPMDQGDDINGLASAGDTLYCAMFMQNQVAALDSITFAIKKTWTLPHPIGLVYDAGDKMLYAVSDGRIVSLDPATGQTKPIVASGLDVPIGLAEDHAGNLWVSCRGKMMQAIGFDKTGKQIGTAGVRGGRPWVGKFDPEGMLMPAGIAIDSQDRLWAPEQDYTPKRQSVWSLSTGKLIRDFYGSAEYAPMMIPDLDHPDQVYMSNTRWIIDYDKGTWRPDATVQRTDWGGPTIKGAEQGSGFMGGSFSLSRYMGHTFAYNGHGAIYDATGDAFKPVEYIGNDYPGWPAPVPDDQKRGWMAVQWLDKNGDGHITADETRYYSEKQIPFPMFENQYGFGGQMFPGATFIKGFKYYKPTGVDANGAPLYPDLDQGTPILTGDGPMKPYFANRYDVWPVLGSNWKQYYQISALSDPKSTEQAIYKFDSNGRIYWRYARTAYGFALEAPLAKPGDLYGALRITGEVDTPSQNAGQVVGIGCYRGYFGFLNEDGLYIDQVGHDNGRGPEPAFDTFYIENFSGYFFKNSQNGKVYLFCGDVDGRILELTGWNTIRRFAGSEIDLTQEDFRKVVASSSIAVPGAAPKAITVNRGLTPTDAGITGWDKTTLAAISIDESHTAKVGLRYDDTGLEAAFDVQDSSPWKNASTDWRYNFKGGDAIDIQLGPTVNSTGARTSQPGDVRLLISPSTDLSGFQAVAMWKTTPTGMTAAPFTYTSPTGEEHFDCVAQVTDLKVSVTRKADGYTVVVTVPWKSLGLSAPARYSRMQGDVGVLLSDTSGVRTTLRRYLFNQDTGIVNDVPSEVRVNSANWGTISFE